MKHLTFTQRAIPLDSYPFEDMAGWEKSLAMRRYSTRTILSYVTPLRFLADWIERESYSPPKDSTPPHPAPSTWPLPAAILTGEAVNLAIAWLKENRSASTTSTYTAGIMSYLEYMYHQRNALSFDYTAFAMEKKVARKGRTNDSHAELDRRYRVTSSVAIVPEVVGFVRRMNVPDANSPAAKLHQLRTLRNRALVETLAETGARIHEVLSMRTKAIYIALNTVGFHDIWAISISGKGSKVREIFISDPKAKKAIQDYLIARGLPTNGTGVVDEPLFVSHGSRKTETRELSRQTVDKLIAKLGDQVIEANASLSHLKGFRLSPHNFRHHKGQHLTNVGVPLEVTRQILGHSSSNTTRAHYAPIGYRGDLVDALKDGRLS